MLTTEHFCQLTSSVTTSLFFKAMSQKDGTPFSTQVTGKLVKLRVETIKVQGVDLDGKIGKVEN